MYDIYLKLRRIGFYMFCIALCCYQMIDILRAYLSYETSISIDYENTSEISLPGITICFDKFDLLRSEVLNKTNISDELRKDRWRLIDYFNYNMTIKAQNQLLLSKEEIFTNACQVMETIGVRKENRTDLLYLNCEHISPIIESIDCIGKCFTMFNQVNDSQANKNFTIDYGTRIFSDLYSEFIALYMQQTIHKAVLNFHRRTESLIRYAEHNFIIVGLKNDTIALIYYKKTTVKLLPSPFKTDCHEYGNANSRLSCVATCRRDVMLRRREAWPDVYFATNLSMELSMFKVWGGINTTFDNEVAEFCKGKCNKKIECTQEIFEMKMEILEEKIEYADNRNMISIMPPIVPDQVITYKQTMSWVELVCFLGSLISLYFGFTFIMLTDIIALVIKSIFKKVLIVFMTNVKNICQRKTKHKNTQLTINNFFINYNNNNNVSNRNFHLEERRQ